MTIRHIRGDSNSSDALTKPLRPEILTKYLPDVSCFSSISFYSLSIDFLLNDLEDLDNSNVDFSFNLQYPKSVEYVRKLSAKEPSLIRVLSSKRTIVPPKRLTYVGNFQQIS